MISFGSLKPAAAHVLIVTFLLLVVGHIPARLFLGVVECMSAPLWRTILTLRAPALIISPSMDLRPFFCWRGDCQIDGRETTKNPVAGRQDSMDGFESVCQDGSCIVLISTLSIRHGQHDGSYSST